MRALSPDQGGRQERALVVVAHPDDECMFFAPTILGLREQGSRVCVLCLSSGNADGLGELRRQEMKHACSLIGIGSVDLMLVDDARLQDGLDQEWEEGVVSEHIKQAVERFDPTLMYTFDESGVSSHPNHAAAFRGMLAFKQSWSASGAHEMQMFVLDTVGLLRKYSAVLDMPLALLQEAVSPDVVSFLNRRPWEAWRALQAHTSQMVWYRKLWMYLSRYMYVNTLRELRLDSII